MVGFVGRMMRDDQGISAFEYMLIAGMLMMATGLALNALDIETGVQGIMDGTGAVLETAADAAEADGK